MKTAQLTLAALASAGIVSLAPAVASACGGFFCNNSAPVEQTGEHILFAVDSEAGTTEAHVLIEYAGPSEEFAWIVPTPSRPEIDISSRSMFTTLDAMLRARWETRWRTEGECMEDPMPVAEGADAFALADTATVDAGSNGGVTIVESRSVGPYDTVTLQATDAAVLIEWLQDNDYDLPDEIKPFVDPYVMMGGDVHFVAFKLQSGRSTGDIEPVRLTYDGLKPAIPIQLTAVATQPDLGVTAYILGDAQAVPENYLSVEINQLRLNWLSGGSNYAELINDAMDEAGGHGFRTEFAGPAADLASAFSTSQYNRQEIEEATASSIVDTLQWQGFAADQVIAALRRHLPVPAGFDEQSFYNCVACYEGEVDLSGFDAEALAADLWETVVEPLQHAEDLFARHDTATRLYTTLSAEEMTLDPIFAFNPDLSDVSNVAEAEVVQHCNPSIRRSDAPLTIVLPDEREIYVPAGERAPVFEELPAMDTAAETAAAGPAVTVLDNRDKNNDALAAYNASVLPAGGEQGGEGEANAGGVTGGSRCSVGGAAWMGSMFFALGLVRRRR